MTWAFIASLHLLNGSLLHPQRSWEEPHWLTHQGSLDEDFLHTHTKYEVNPLGVMCIYIYMRTCLPLTAMWIYIFMQYKQAPTALSYIAKQNCGINSCLLSSNKPHISTYITTQKRQGGAVLVHEWSWIWQGLPNVKLFLEQKEQTASSFHLRQKVGNQLKLSRL